MAMPGVGRYVKMTAKAGQGEELARILLDVAGSLAETPGCELYVINRSPTEPEAVWVTELWRSQDELDGSLRELNTEAGRARMAEVMRLLEGAPERIDLEPLGGVGHSG
jgi:quinol monooxygenase YgiN